MKGNRSFDRMATDWNFNCSRPVLETGPTGLNFENKVLKNESDDIFKNESIVGVMSYD